LNDLVNLTLCDLSPQNTVDVGFTCPYTVPLVCRFNVDDICVPLSAEIQAMIDLKAAFNPPGWTGTTICDWSNVCLRYSITC